MPPPLPSTDHFVTSSNLVRHFGLWQDRATRAPLYILHRGRPRFVLTSIETMEALCAPHVASADKSVGSGVDAGMLLDGMGDLVLVADSADAIVASSRSARAHFGALAAIGAPLDAIAAPASQSFLVDAIRRVAATGAGERLDIASAGREGRALTVAIEPAGGGVALFAQDGATARDVAQAVAAERALAEAIGAAGGVTIARINPRGYVVDPAPALLALTGLSHEALAAIRFVALADTAARFALAAAIEAAMAGVVSATVAAALLVNHADPVAVRIGLAPLRGASGITGVVAAIVTA